jgi:hypothetical protein
VSPTPAAGCQDGQRTVKPPHNPREARSDALCPAGERSTALATWDQFDEPFDLDDAPLEACIKVSGSDTNANLALSFSTSRS